MNRIDFSFFVNNDTLKKLTFFTMSDIFMVLIWLVLIIGYGVYKRTQNQEKIHYKYYMYNLYFKIFFSFVCAIYYIVIVRGGDAIAYWDLAKCMNNLFWISPENYLNNMWYDFHDPEFINRYNPLTTGVAPTWILRESPGFFTAKITSLFTFLSGGSFLVITLMFASIVANVSWRFYELVLQLFPSSNRWVTWGVLFIPSVSFWCTGISKDSLAYISILVILTHGLKLIYQQASQKWYSWLIILFHLWLLLHVRSVVLLALIIPFLFVISMRFAKRFQESPFFKRAVQVFVALVSTLLFFVAMQSFGTEMNVDAYIEEAAVTQQDFAQNPSYTGAKYTIDVPDYTPFGMLLALPSSVFAGWFRPFVWEALSVSLLLNGIESLLLLYLAIRFLRHPLDHIRILRKHELLIWCFFFALILGFITGFSSIIFGVLVRLRAPLLPFLVLLLALPLALRLDEKKEKQALD